MKNTLPTFTLGTWLMGGTKDPDPNNDDQRDIRVIRTAIDNEVTLIDTAQNYAAGRCEELVGQAVAPYQRQQYQILTKQNRLRLSYTDVLGDCQASMERLGVETLDYFVCHAPNTDFDMRDFFRAANKLYGEGRIKHVGVSNFGPKMLALAEGVSDVPIALNQVSFSPQDADIITSGTYEYCLQHNIPVQAYRTLVGMDASEVVSGLVKGIAREQALTPAQVVIAYLFSYKNIHFTVRSSSPEHWAELRHAITVKLPAADIERLRSEHMKQTGAFGHFLSL